MSELISEEKYQPFANEIIKEVLNSDFFIAALNRAGDEEVESGNKIGSWIESIIRGAVDAVASHDASKEPSHFSEGPRQQASQSKQPVRHGRQLRLVVIEVPENLGDAEIEEVRSAAQLIAEQIR